MHPHRQLYVLVLLLVVFIGLGVLNLYIANKWGLLGFAPFNASAANNTAVSSVCIGGPPPQITDIPDQSATVDALFQYTVNATQSQGHTLNFTDDTSLFVINLNTGLISFTPNSSDTGDHTITVTVRDTQNCPSTANDTDTFILSVSNQTNVTQAPPPGRICTGGGCGPPHHPSPAPPAPSPPAVELAAPYYVLVITHITAPTGILYDRYNNVHAEEYSVAPDSVITLEITVRNIGFNELSNVHLNIPVPDHVQIIAINPPNVPELLINQEYTFVVQLETSDIPFDFVVDAIADQDRDTQVIAITHPPEYETPQFGFQLPPWLPLFIAIPLLFFLGYSIVRNRELLRQILQNLLTALFAWLFRRTYFLDEDMLRRLIKAKKLNKFLHLRVVPDVHARYHDQYKNLRTKELKKEDFDKIAQIIRQYAIGGEMATLIRMTEEKPKPRIMTLFILSKKLADDYKRIKFYDPLKQEEKKEQAKEAVIATAPQMPKEPPHSL